MQKDDPITSILGHCLIAMPDMPDPRFQGSVVLLVAHSEDGAMGIIINKRIEDVRFSDILEQISLSRDPEVNNSGIYFGGPVEHGRGFVVHSSEYESDLSTIRVDESLSMTSTIDILEDMAHGRGPDNALIALGYSGWGQGQLEREIAANGWLVTPATPELVFGTPDAKKWSAALAELGINPAILATSGGSA